MIIYIDTTISKIAKVQIQDETTVVAAKEGTDAVLLINQLLVEQNLTPADIEEIKINEGPGSFTGVRVAAAVANVFNWLNGKKLITELKY